MSIFIYFSNLSHKMSSFVSLRHDHALWAGSEVWAEDALVIRKLASGGYRLLAQDQPEDRTAAQPRHLPHARGGREARARRAILQAKGLAMAPAKQRAAARRNIKKAATAARRKRTIAHLPKKTAPRLASRPPRSRSRSAGRSARPSRPYHMADYSLPAEPRVRYFLGRQAPKPYFMAMVVTHSRYRNPAVIAAVEEIWLATSIKGLF